MRLRRWVICAECGRKYKADRDTNYPVKHYVPPMREKIGEIEYLINAPWDSYREVCKGVYKEGEEMK